MINLVQFPGLGLSLHINRVAISLGGFNIYWYGIILAAGLMGGLLFAFRYGPDFGIDTDRMVDVVVIGTVMAIVCARTYYVAMAPFQYQSLWEMMDLRNGGIAIYGGLIGAFVFGGLACKWRNGLFDRPGRWPLGKLCQPGSIWLQHYTALGNVQRSHPKLSCGQCCLTGGAGHDGGPHDAGASHIFV